MSIDNHTITVINSDGGDIEPEEGELRRIFNFSLTLLNLLQWLLLVIPLNEERGNNYQFITYENWFGYLLAKKWMDEWNSPVGLALCTETSTKFSPNYTRTSYSPKECKNVASFNFHLCFQIFFHVFRTSRNKQKHIAIFSSTVGAKLVFSKRKKIKVKMEKQRSWVC